ncbi:MAG TPA: DUF3472 domain-containing protein [Candidatus Binatia bacterium]|jgi:hypothetical protein|nr:DUF3472 domain-containing protein [Candidatus Binatia bacterium]
MKTWRYLLLLAALAGSTQSFAELRIPAWTAYVEPNPEGAAISPRNGVTGWNDPNTKLLWFGDFKHAGTVTCSLVLRLPPNATSKLRLTLAGTSQEVLARGAEKNPLIVPIGTFNLSAPGYQRLTLQSLNEAGHSAGELEAIVLDRPASVGAHFNLKPRRNTASVHLFYPTTGLTNIDAFYCEVTALEDPLWTFFMACGWHRGYFGMQVNSPTERRIIFSVWDSGGESADRNKVQADNRVELVAKGNGVYTGDFGNEGTGGHSHLVFPWRTAEKQKFLVTAQPADATHTVFSGYYFVPGKKCWMLISSWRAPREGGYLHGLHSFGENFGGANGHLRRKALYGNQWVRTADGRWKELTTATFSHDPTGKADRLDRFMGVEEGQFFLSHGGFLPGSSRYGEKFERPPAGNPPSDLPIP